MACIPPLTRNLGLLSLLPKCLANISDFNALAQIILRFFTLA
jgi:hypothetical protein